MGWIVFGSRGGGGQENPEPHCSWISSEELSNERNTKMGNTGTNKTFIGPGIYKMVKSALPSTEPPPASSLADDLSRDNISPT